MPTQQKGFMRAFDRTTKDAVESEGKCELAAEVLRSVGALHLRVTGCSMLPAVRPGDTLKIERPTAGQFAVGDIVVFSRGGRLIAHRVLFASTQDENANVITQGDASPSPDAPVSVMELLGKATHILRSGELRISCGTRSFSDRLIAGVLRRAGWVARVAAHLQSVFQNSWERKAQWQS
jgi:signal peptidase I